MGFAVCLGYECNADMVNLKAAPYVSRMLERLTALGFVPADHATYVGYRRVVGRMHTQILNLEELGEGAMIVNVRNEHRCVHFSCKQNSACASS